MDIKIGDLHPQRVLLVYQGYLVKVNDVIQVTDTILHEIAHAVTHLVMVMDFA
jgi:hypothetical protein